MYPMAEIYTLIGKGPSPFIDPEEYLYEINLNEQAIHNRLEGQIKMAETARTN